MKVLVFGLQGSGKGYVAKYISEKIKGVHLDVCKVRTDLNDWGMSIQTRIKVNEHLKSAALGVESCNKIVVMESLAEFAEIRSNLDPDYIIWVDSISDCGYDDTNLFFQQPKEREVINYILKDITDEEEMSILLKDLKRAISKYKKDRK